MKIINKGTGDTEKEAKAIYDTHGILSFIEIKGVMYDPKAFELVDEKAKEVEKKKPQAKTSGKK